MVRTTTYNYEVSSEGGRERHIRIPYARQTDQTPTLHDPAEVTSLLPGTALTGTVISLDTVNNESIINVAQGARYWHNVRNVLTYAAPNEATWGAVNVGDPVYYDGSAAMPATTKLSKSPFNVGGGANALFGYVGLRNDELAASYPKGVGGVAGTYECAIIQK